MYHCRVKGYLVGASEEISSAICNITPLEHFEHNFTCGDTIDKSILKDSDLTIAFWNEDIAHEKGYTMDDWAKELCSGKKQGAYLVLCVPGNKAEHILKCYENDLYDVWHLPISLTQIVFRFKQWQQHDKMVKDQWLSSQYLDVLINSVPHLIWYKDKHGAHLKVNDSFCKAVNKTREQIQGRGHLYIWDLDPEEYASGEFICMESEDEVMEKRQTCVFDENVKIGDEMRKFDTYKSPLIDLDGSVMGTVGLANDVTKEKQYEAIMIQRANTDFLTGLYNRRYLLQYIETTNMEPMVFYYLDLDNFKTINDKYGHQTGDRALILATEVLKKEFPDALISRIGGDEFLVVQSEEMSAEAIEKERLHMADVLDSAFAQDDKLCIVTASVGTSYSPAGEPTDADAKMEEADDMMYNEKKAKKKNR
jgi:diguanylate cyclase (GGDEF)-like protein/PAS domain S-box-containing protein